MIINTKFRGRIFQVIEALDYGDACSNQVVELDLLLRQQGFITAIFSKYHHEKMSHFRSDLEKLRPRNEDLVIIHYAGFSYHSFPLVQELRCTKICVYHNITPHTFFRPETDIYEFCRKGRQQLLEVVRDCHYFWGDSRYNLQELIDLGADPSKCSLVPIIVGKHPLRCQILSHSQREEGTWMFLGRVAANKGHVNLVKMFAEVRRDDPSSAQKLYIIGGFSKNDSYFQDLQAEILRLQITEQVILTGKISDAEVNDYLARAAVYVSLSEHEGFGVPLIEASHHGLPVVALRNTAVGETLGEKWGLAESVDGLSLLLKEIMSNNQIRQELVGGQKLNAMRFSRESVNKLLIEALQSVLPDCFRFTKVSIVICTYNRGPLLERCLDYLQYQTNQNFEVVVINGPSTDNTNEVLDANKHKVKIGQNPKPNLSVSRNMGIELSDGDLIAFIDDDAIPFDDWVDSLLSEFSEVPLTYAAIGGPAYYSGSLKFQSQDIAINKLAEAKVDIDSSEVGTDGWERSMLGTNACYRSDVLRKICGFDEQFDYFLDESELSFRIQRHNYIVGYSPNLHLRHEFAQSDNRAGKYKFNWYSICKNTAYFIAAYSGLKGQELRDYVENRMNSDRIANLNMGLSAGELSQVEYEKHISAVNTGAMQGLCDAEHFPHTRELQAAPNLFKPYTNRATYPLGGKDIKILHICIITKEFPPFITGGGIGTLYYHLASELLLMGHHVSVIVPGDFKTNYRQGRFSVRYVPQNLVCADSVGAPAFTNNVNWSLDALHSLAELHSSNPVDVVDSALWDSEALALSLIPKEQRPPLVVRLVTPFTVAARINNWSLPEQDCNFLKTAERTLIANADLVVPISESIANTIEIEHEIKRDARWMKSYCGISYWPSFDVWKNYAQLDFINGLPFAVPKDAKLILFVGRLERRKGVDLLIEAARSFLLADTSAHLVIAGKDVEGWGQATMANINGAISARIHFLGEVDDAERDKLLNRSYAMIFPSRYESFGLVPLEAFIHGIPVVATNAGAIPEVVVHDKCGLLFEPENFQSLAASVTRLLAEPGLRDRLATGARKQIRKFSSRNSAINTVKLYADLLLKERSSSRSVMREETSASSPIQSSVYLGSNPLLLTQCGKRDGKSLKTTNTEGFFLHGPYIDLPAGNYKANLYGQVKSVGKPDAYVEVVINSGNEKLASCILAPTNNDTLFASLCFCIALPAQVEVRLWVAFDADIVLRKLAILAENDMSAANPSISKSILI
jgi:glycosyltransferase involved in cell wall biosynthesis